MKTKIQTIIVTLIFLFSCNEKEEKECCKKETSANVAISNEISDESLFNITSDWKTQDNKSIKKKTPIF